MLVSYPVEAIEENWLHGGLAAVLTRALDQQQEPMTDWLLEFPVERRNAVESRPSLRQRLELVVASIAALGKAQRDALSACLAQQNDLPGVFSSLAAPSAIAAEPPALKLQLASLFEKAFELLTDLGIRDRQYQRVYDHVSGHVCGFCGIEPLSAPGPDSPREHLDHYLAVSLYPLAAANMRNLAPIGGRCNTAFKKAKDVLRSTGGAPRRCFDPYGAQQVQVSLMDSHPLRGPVRGAEQLTDWNINFIGADSDRVETWNEVFDVRRRYRDDILDASFSDWLTHFAVWAVDDPPTDHASLVTTIRRYLKTVVQEGIAGGNFLKRATFQMLEHRLLDGPEAARISRWLLSLWDPDEGAIA